MNGILQVILIVAALGASRAYPYKDTNSEVVETPLDPHDQDEAHDTVKVKRRIYLNSANYLDTDKNYDYNFYFVNHNDPDESTEIDTLNDSAESTTIDDADDDDNELQQVYTDAYDEQFEKDDSDETPTPILDDFDETVEQATESESEDKSDIVDANVTGDSVNYEVYTKHSDEPDDGEQYDVLKSDSDVIDIDAPENKLDTANSEETPKNSQEIDEKKSTEHKCNCNCNGNQDNTFSNRPPSYPYYIFPHHIYPYERNLFNNYLYHHYPRYMGRHFSLTGHSPHPYPFFSGHMFL